MELERAMLEPEDSDQPEAEVEPEIYLTHERLCHELYMAVQEAMGGGEVDKAGELFEKDPEKWLRMGYARKRWKSESTVNVDGQIDHDMTLEVQCPAPREVLIEAVGVLQTLRLANDPRAFRQIGVTQKSESASDPSNGNGETKP